MSANGAFAIEEIDSPIQRVIHRRWAFFVLPIAATIAALALMAWEIIRQNLPAGILLHWPWRLKLLDLQSGATVATVLILFLIARAQYAEAVRPVIGWSLRPARIRQRPSLLKNPEDVLTLEIFNGGGLAVIESVSYRFARNEDSVPSPWVSYDRFDEYMSRAGLTRLEDYFFEFIRAGAPFITKAGYGDGSIVGAIRVGAIFRFRILDIKIEVRDAVGDAHERVLPCRFAIKDSVDHTGFVAPTNHAQASFLRSYMGCLVDVAANAWRHRPQR
jgi:hypothetical protein